MVAVVCVTAAVTVGCSFDDGTSRPPPAPDATATSTSMASTTSVSSETTLPAGGCPEGDSMVSDGRLLETDRPGADGQTIGGVTWRSAGDCHTITIAFTTADGAPATTPPTLVARLIRNAGVIRIETDATASLVVDQVVESSVIGSMYVPVTGEGTRFVDLTLLEPVVGRATTLTSPAQLQIELQVGGTPDMGSPLVTDDLVVVEPVAGAVDDPIIDVSGYAIGPEETIVFDVLSNETVVDTDELVVGGSEAMWTAFETSIQVPETTFDGLRISDDDGTIAGIPFTPSSSIPPATQP